MWSFLIESPLILAGLLFGTGIILLEIANYTVSFLPNFHIIFSILSIYLIGFWVRHPVNNSWPQLPIRVLEHKVIVEIAYITYAATSANLLPVFLIQMFPKLTFLAEFTNPQILGFFSQILDTFTVQIISLAIFTIMITQIVYLTKNSNIDHFRYIFSLFTIISCLIVMLFLGKLPQELIIIIGRLIIGIPPIYYLRASLFKSVPLEYFVTWK